MAAEMRKFGQRVRQLRLARGWTLAQLGDLVGCSAGELGEIERGRREIVPAGIVEKLARQLDADIDELFVLAGWLPPCLRWIQGDPGVARLLGSLVVLIDSRVSLSGRPGGQRTGR